MTEKKYTDEEIIRGLEFRMHEDALCLEAYDLIKRQKADLEQLQHKYELAVAEREANIRGFTEAIAKYEK